MIFRHRDGSFELSSRTLVFGIINVTPDSFSDGGECFEADAAVARARELIAHGADVLDIGGESTRPGAQPVTAEEELRRVLPVIAGLRQETTVPISVDTTKAAVAEAAIAAGASILNDISALRFDPRMAEVARKTGAGVILMHMQGTPQTMQANPHYEDVVREVAGFLRERLAFATAQGIERERIMVDPGIGFGKTLDHNLELLRRLNEMLSLDRPVLVGASRKSFIARTVGADIEQRDWGTAATVAHCIAQGAHAVRVHNVELCRQVARMTEAVVRVGA
jgi:dihydropteroate synthase